MPESSGSRAEWRSVLAYRGTDVAQRLLADAGRHLTSAAAAPSGQDLSGAFQLAYDALRKSAASLLAVQGLRATGHLISLHADPGLVSA